MRYNTLQEQNEYEKREEFNKYIFHLLNELYSEEIKLIDCEDICDQLSLEEFCFNLDPNKINKLKEFWSKKKIYYSNDLSKSKALNISENIKVYTLLTEHIQNKLDFYSSFSGEPPIKIIEKKEKMEQIQKIIMLHEFGIIQYLDKVWEENKIKTKVEYLISSLIDEPADSIRPRLSNPDDPKLNTDPAITKSSEYLLKFGLEKGEILKSKQK